MSREQAFIHLISGQTRGPAASAARGVLSLMTPAYASAVLLRNRAFDGGWRRAIQLPRPTVSVGNITVGGTGKTPLVAWLARELAERGRRPGVLMRGYKSRPGRKGDEQRLLETLLGDAVPVEADPDRTRAGARVLASRNVDLFLLDDGFQHRRVARQVDLVLIDATRPFGYGRVLPRGLLREPLAGLARATALLITRTGLVSAESLAGTEAALRRQSSAPVFHCDFALDLPQPPGRRYAIVCAIGNPGAFADSVRRQGGEVAELITFADHHDYTAQDVRKIQSAAGRADALLTTGKDWVKLQALWPPEGPAMHVARQHLEFRGEDGQRLLELVMGAINRPRDGGLAS